MKRALLDLKGTLFSLEGEFLCLKGAFLHSLLTSRGMATLDPGSYASAFYKDCRAAALAEILCGVPQGHTMCCPLLFHIYINNLPNSSNFLSFYLLAHETNIHIKSDNFRILKRRANKELTTVKCWLDCNKLTVNITKANVVYFHSFRKTISDSINHRLGKDIIKRIKNIKFLGILVDK